MESLKDGNKLALNAMSEIVEKNKENTSIGIFKSIMQDFNKDEAAQDTFSISKYEEKDEFLKVFVDSIDFFKFSNNTEKNMFFFAMKKCNYKNIVTIDTNFRAALSKIYGVKPSQISRALRGLVQNTFLIPLELDILSEQEKKFFDLSGVEKKVYLLNPHIVGKGSFRDLKKVRQVFTREFDFEKMEVKKKSVNDFSYVSSDDINKQYKVKQIKVIENNQNGTDVDVIIKEKENLDKAKVGIEFKPTNQQVGLFDNISSKEEIIEASDVDEEASNLSAAIQSIKERNLERKKEAENKRKQELMELINLERKLSEKLHTFQVDSLSSNDSNEYDRIKNELLEVQQLIDESLE